MDICPSPLRGEARWGCLIDATLPSVPSPQGRGYSERGFTLVELLVVIFVLSLMTALVLPSFTSSEGEVKGEARKVASLIRHTNESAASKKETLHLTFDLDHGTVKWGEGGEGGYSLKHLAGVELQGRGLVKEGELTVFFRPTGVGEHMWVYIGRGEGGLAVVYNPVSGRVKVDEAARG
jgi:prepilin-type N-terminal cleavage/methylation domain-containing protein